MTDAATDSVVSRFPPSHILHVLLRGDREQGNGNRGAESDKAQVASNAVVEEIDEFTIIADTSPVAAPTTTAAYSCSRGRGMVREEMVKPQTKHTQPKRNHTGNGLAASRKTARHI